MALGPVVLPSEGDMDAAVGGYPGGPDGRWSADLPGTSFSDASKAALVALIAELPNPSGDLTLGLRAEPGLGPVRAWRAMR